MVKKTIPEVVTYVCDVCGTERDRVFDTKLIIRRTGRDFQGHAVGGVTAERDLCNECVTKLNKFMETT